MMDRGYLGSLTLTLTLRSLFSPGFGFGLLLSSSVFRLHVDVGAHLHASKHFTWSLGRQVLVSGSNPL